MTSSGRTRVLPSLYWEAMAEFAGLPSDAVYAIMKAEARNLRTPESYARHTAAFATLNERAHALQGDR